MKFPVKCIVCGETISVRGVDEWDVNAVSLDENDDSWDEACEHIKAGGDYEIGEGESDDDEY
jgi:DNA-directed RNA polymerase subunit N (RpoN/RPB10)